MKLYISGAITHNEDYLTDFSNAERLLVDAGFEVVNPVTINQDIVARYSGSMKDRELWELCVRNCLIALCDTSITGIASWGNVVGSEGVRLERYVGRQLSIPILSAEEWIATHNPKG